MPRLLTAAEIHQKRINEGLVDFNPEQGDTRQIGADNPRLGREFWKPPTERPRYISSKEVAENKRLEEAERDAQFRRDMAPVWAEQERVAAEELRLRRETGYRSELDDIAESNTQIAGFQVKIKELGDQLYVTKSVMMEEPHNIDAILAHAEKLPVLREAIPLLEAGIKRSEKSLREWQTYGEGIAQKLHTDLTLRVSEWRALQISELQIKVHQDLLKMFGSEPKPQLLDGVLKTSKEYKALQSPVRLPSVDSLDLTELKAAIETVEALTMPRERQGETAPTAVAEAPHETNSTKAATRSKERHAVSR